MSTETVSTELPKHPLRSKIRDIILDWPDPPVPFQEIVFGQRVQFPVLLFPWNGGRQIIYSVDDQNTYWENVPPVWWFYPETTKHLNGEEFRPNMGRIKYAWYFVQGWDDPTVEIPAAKWLVNDICDFTLDANARAYAMVNLGPQPEGVVVARPVQVNSVETFNKYLKQFQSDGFLGVLARPLNHMYGQAQFAVIRPLKE